MPNARLGVPVEYNGIRLTYTTDLTEEDEAHLGDFTGGLLAYLETSGLKPVKQAAVVQQAAAQTQNGGGRGGYAQRGGNGGGGYQRGGGNGYGRSNDGWACPVHGDRNIGPGYQNRGLECKVYTDDADSEDPNNEWTKQKGQERNDGTIRYYCRFNNQSRG